MNTPDPADVAEIDNELDAIAATPTDVGALVDELAAMALDAAGQDQPVPVAAGTFAMYPMADGGLMFVTAVDAGPLAGLKHTRIPPAMIRAVSTLAAGGSKMGALKAMWGGGRKAIGGN